MDNVKSAAFAGTTFGSAKKLALIVAVNKLAAGTLVL